MRFGLLNRASVIVTCRNALSSAAKQCFNAETGVMLPHQTFAGKTAIVTGGGTGIGKGIATHLSKLGANVFIMSRKEDVLKDACKDIVHESGNEVSICIIIE